MARREAFSLTELIVAIGILVLMFSLAGQVFNLTIKSTGQARALTEVNQLLRAFEQTIREELEEVQPGQSMILIQGNPVNAYWIQQGKEADNDGNPSTGYPHINDPAREDADGNLIKPRADILMFFTSRAGSSFVHPGVTSSLQQVVYGHAELGEYVRSSSGYDFEDGPDAFREENNYPSMTLVSPIPAERWHLARRGVLLVPTGPPAVAPKPERKWANARLASAFARGLAKDNDPKVLSILLGETDVVFHFNESKYVSTPGTAWPWCLPEIFDDVMKNHNPDYLPFARSRLDPTPPAPLASQLGHYFLPNCASFKVEWTLDPRGRFAAGRLDGEREVYWFDPGRFDPNDPKDEHPLAELQEARNAAKLAWVNDQDDQRLEQRMYNLHSLLEGDTVHPDGLPPYSLSDRFLGTRQLWTLLAKDFFGEEADTRPNLVVFGAARYNADADKIVAEDIFPAALRITIDVFDSERRLERPIRHVIVAPVGSE